MEHEGRVDHTGEDTRTTGPRPPVFDNACPNAPHLLDRDASKLLPRIFLCYHITGHVTIKT